MITGSLIFVELLVFYTTPDYLYATVISLSIPPFPHFDKKKEFTSSHNNFFSLLHFHYIVRNTAFHPISLLWIFWILQSILICLVTSNVVTLNVNGGTLGCADVEAEICQLSFSLSTLSKIRQVVEVTTNNWGLGVTGVVQPSTGGISSSRCTLTSTGTLRLTFRADESVVQCNLLKKANIITPRQTGRIIPLTTGSDIIESTIRLPTISYSKPNDFIFNPSVECQNSNINQCSAQLTLPINMSQHFIIDTTANLSWECPSDVFDISNPIIIQKRVIVEFGTYSSEEAIEAAMESTDRQELFTANRYNLTTLLSPLGTNTATTAVTCNLTISKGVVSPYFKIYLPYTSKDINNVPIPQIEPSLQLIYTTSSILYTEISIEPQDDCRNTNSPLCTIIYNNIPLPHDFIVNIDFFTQNYDFMPMVDPTYIPIGGERRYIQRYLKSVAMDSTIYNNDNPRFANVYLYSPLLDRLTFRIAVQQFVYSKPLTISYDEEECKNGLSPICPLRITSSYVGRPLAITLSRLPFDGVIDSIQCDSNGAMFIDPEQPQNIYFISPNQVSEHPTNTFLNNPPLNMVDVYGNANNLTNDDFSYEYGCIINLSLPYGKDIPFNNPLKNNVNFFITQVLFFYPIKQYVELSIPLLELQRDEVLFDVLPFDLKPHESCIYQYEPNCGYTITMSLNNSNILSYMNKNNNDDGDDNIDGEDGSTFFEDIEELQNILEKVYLRSFSLPVYNLREPQWSNGETIDDVMRITVEGSRLLLVSITNVEWSKLTLGYDIVEFTVTTYNDILNIEEYFNKNYVTDLFENDIEIHFQFLHRIPTTEEIQDKTRHDRAYQIRLLSYNGISYLDNFSTAPLLYTSQPGEFFFMPLFVFGVDDEVCKNKHKAYCPLSCRVYTDLSTMSGYSANFLQGVVLHSMLVELPTSSVIDISADHSTQGLKFQIVSNRLDPLTNLPNDKLYANITLPRYTAENIDTSNGYYDFDLLLVKRLGVVNQLTRFQATDYLFIREEEEDNNNNNNNNQIAEWIPASAPYFYALTNVNFVGDVTFTFADDCADPGSIICTAFVNIATNDLQPGTQILRFDAQFVLRVFYYVDGVRCRNWDNISEEESPKYIQLKYDPITRSEYAEITTNQDDKFSTTKPLHFDPKRFPNGASCTVINYKQYNPTKQWTPLIYPTLYHDIDYEFDSRYSIYPISRLVPGLALNYPAMRYAHFDMEGLEDCQTSYLNYLQCTLKLTSNASPQYPINNIRIEMEQDDVRRHGLLSAPINLGDLLYVPIFCQQKQEIVDNNNNNTNTIIDDNNTNIIHNIAGNGIKPSDYFKTNPDVLELANALGLTITDDLIVKRQYSINTDPNAERQVGINNINRRAPGFFGIWELSYHACDLSQKVTINVDLAQRYKNNHGVGYVRLYWEYADYDIMGIQRPDQVQLPVTSQVLVNIPDIIDQTKIYPFGTVDPSIVISSPSRLQIPPLVFGWTFRHEIEETRVSQNQNVSISWIFYAESIEAITIHTLLGDFSEPTNYKSCDYNVTVDVINEITGEVEQGIQSQPLAVLSTNPLLGISTLTINNTFLNELRLSNPSDDNLGIRCTIPIEVNSIYPSEFANVKHETLLNTLPTERFYAYRNYPQYLPTSRIWSVSESSLYSSSMSLPLLNNCIILLITICCIILQIM